MIGANARIFVATKTVDFRGSFDLLGGVVREHLRSDPRSGAFFVFFNRRLERATLCILSFRSREDGVSSPLVISGDSVGGAR
jgi:hypothetical protein